MGDEEEPKRKQPIKDKPERQVDSEPVVENHDTDYLGDWGALPRPAIELIARHLTREVGCFIKMQQTLGKLVVAFSTIFMYRKIPLYITCLWDIISRPFVTIKFSCELTLV